MEVSLCTIFRCTMVRNTTCDHYVSLFYLWDWGLRVQYDNVLRLVVYFLFILFFIYTKKSLFTFFIGKVFLLRRPLPDTYFFYNR